MSIIFLNSRLNNCPVCFFKLLFFLLYIGGGYFAASAQTNVALTATATHGGSNSGGAPNYGPNLYNNNSIPTCAGTGTGEWGWVANGGWIEFTWGSAQTFDQVRFYKANRPMQTCVIQYWNGSSYVNIMNYNNSTTCDHAVSFAPVTTTRLRFNNIQPVSGQASPNHREIQVLNNCTPPAVPGTITHDTWTCANATCTGSRTYSIAPVSGATTYTWSVSGGGTITAGQGTTNVTINWTTAGTYTLSVTSGNGSCNSTARTTTVKLFAGCANNTTNQNNTTAAITPGCNAFENTTMALLSFRQVAVVQDINYSFSTCTSTPTAIDLTVKDGSNVIQASNNGWGPHCQNDRGSLNWTSSFSGNARAYLHESNCNTTWSGTSAILQVRQNTTVNNNTTTTGIAQCQTKALTATLAGEHNNPTISWSVVSGSGTVGSISQSGATSTAIFTPTGDGSVTVRATVGVCSQDRTFSVNALPSQPSAISGATTVCSGVSESYSVTNIAGVTYTWTYSGTGTLSGGNGNTQTLNATTGGTLSVTPSVNGCSGTARTATIAVTNAATVAGITAPSALCAGSPLNMTTPGVTANGSALTSQGWQLETGVGTGSYNAVSLPYTTVFADNGKRLRYFATNGCGTTYSNLVALTVNNVPTVAGITAPSALCAGSPLNMTTPSVTANGSTVTSQGWQLETGVGTGSYNALSLPYTTAFADNGKRLRYFATNGCGTTYSNLVALTVNNVATVAGITAPSALCAGSPLNMTTPGVTANGSALTSQGWQLETGVGTGSYNAVSLPYTTAFADNGKRLRYFATNGCGTTYSNLVAVTVNNVPTVAVITAPSALCAGSPLNMTTPSVTANGSALTSQGWQLETGVGTGSYNAVSLPYTTAFADNGKRLRYFATNGCGTTYSNLVAVTVNNAATVSVITAPSALCAGSPLNMTTPSVTANGSALTSQGWHLETGVGTGSYNAVSLPYTTAFADNGKRLRYFATNGCGTTYSNLVTLTVDATSVGGTVSSDQTICHGASANTLTLSGQTGSVTKWQVNTGSWTDIPATAGLLSYSPGALTVGVQYRAVVQSGACPEGNSTAATVTVPAMPTAISTGSNAGTCGLASENNWVYFANNSNQLLAAIQDNTGGGNLGSTQVSVTEHGGVQTYNGESYMQRVTAITPASNASSMVRLYFTEAQYQALKASNPNYSAYSYSDLRITKFAGTLTAPSGSPTLIGGSNVVLNGFATGVHYIEFANTNYSTFFIHFGDDVSPLPVSLSSFNASCENGFVKIDWVTESETNNELFTVSRSADLMNWEDILTRLGGHNSNQPLYYTGYDERPLEGISYYRLTQRDYDGTTETFAPVGVVCQNGGEGNSLAVYPNPINDVYTVRITAAKATKGARLNLSDMNGKTIQTAEVDLVEGVNEFSYDRMLLNPGTYILSLTSDKFTVRPVKVVVK